MTKLKCQSLWWVSFLQIQHFKSIINHCQSLILTLILSKISSIHVRQREVSVFTNSQRKPNIQASNCSKHSVSDHFLYSWFCMMTVRGNIATVVRATVLAIKHWTLIYLLFKPICLQGAASQWKAVRWGAKAASFRQWVKRVDTKAQYKDQFNTINPVDWSFTETFSFPQQMMDSRLSAQERTMRNLPADRGFQKTSTYIVPCFLLVEVSVTVKAHFLQHFSALVPAVLIRLNSQQDISAWFGPNIIWKL